MAPWGQLDIDKPHLAYIIIGGFTSLFMLCSLFVKEKLYIGEATVATICGIIFGPHAANLFNPGDWGNTDKITLECSRIVLVVQCFAVGVELPKAYMERHWRSVTFLLVPVMTFGWLITSIFIWWMIAPLSWLESLAVAACVTATDPVLASSVVGKGKFAKRVPKHLRDVLSAESGCNDGMAFPFIYLSLYLIRYNSEARETVFHWACFTILYECIFGAFYGFMIGYIGRHAIKTADRYGLIDRESFLVFYFVLALFCAGSGSLLGMDDLLVGFSAGVGFSNDGWFTRKTEEAHVSNVIDLLLNLAYFVYFGSIIPWEQYGNFSIGLEPWRLVVIALMVIFFRRIPVMLALKPFIPDVKNWREALFAGHFGPIGVGAVFAAMVARAELENDLESTEPLGALPGPGSPHYILIQLIWPVVSFLVVTSIIVHGSSIAVFTLGKRINTLTLTMSYTQGNDGNWLNRLPRIGSTSRSMSKGRGEYDSTDESNEKLQFPPGTLPPTGLPGIFLRRQKEEDNPSRAGSRASSLRPPSRRKKSKSHGAGGPITQSAIMPQRNHEEPPTSPISLGSPSSPTTPGSPDVHSFFGHGEDDGGEGEAPDQLEMQDAADKDLAKHAGSRRNSSEIEIFREGDHMIVEDEEGNVLDDENVRGETEEEIKRHVLEARDALRKETSGEHAKSKHHSHEKNSEGEDLMHTISAGLETSSPRFKHMKQRVGDWNDRRREGSKLKSDEERLRGPAHAYQYGNTIIVEDEDGEVVRKYDIPAAERKKAKADGGGENAPRMRQGLRRVGTWAGIGGSESSTAQPDAEASGSNEQKKDKLKVKTSVVDEDNDERIRFTIGIGGRRMTKVDFIKQIQSLDPKTRVKAIDEADASEPVKRDIKDNIKRKGGIQKLQAIEDQKHPEASGSSSKASPSGKQSELREPHPEEDCETGTSGLTLVDSNGNNVPVHSVSDSIARYSQGQPETAVPHRRRPAPTNNSGSDKETVTKADADSDSDSPERFPPPSNKSKSVAAAAGPSSSSTPDFTEDTSSSRSKLHSRAATGTNMAEGETVAERRRRLAALGEAEDEQESDSDEDGLERKPTAGRQPVAEPDSPETRARPAGIRFADSPAPSQGRVQWGEAVGGEGRDGRGDRWKRGRK